MKERPILFSGEMIRALLSGRKTQTRRVVNPQPTNGCHYVMNEAQSGACHLHTEAFAAKQFDKCYVPPTPKSASHILPCPYGQPGDRLWVRETYLIAHVDHLFSIPKTRPDWMDSIGKYLLYGADGSCCQQIPKCQCASVGKLPWRPSIHMPRWASRLTLEITGVRVERLQDISEEDAIAEGLEQTPNGRWKSYDVQTGSCCDPIPSYKSLWQSINGPGSWERNDCVWVVEFKIVRGGASA